ncbi:hypothetical protein HID58_061186, partial [Brassica napus]
MFFAISPYFDLTYHHLFISFTLPVLLPGMIVMFWSRVLIVRLVLLSTALRFANFILFSIPSPFSHLLAVFIAARISSSSHFCHVWIVFSSVYVQWAWKVVYGIKLELWFLGGWLPFSLPQSFVVLRWHWRLALVCE